jgi:cellulose synthase/poly-beta-1,6-N-acetylglucosamine synthase-like glycosyltransferase
MMDKLSCSLGVFCHNVAGNIISLLQGLIDQELSKVEISEIIVVSSASTDGTDDLVERFARQHPKVKLFTQARREGKSSAINLFLAEAAEDLLVIISGDVIPARDNLEKLVSAFADSSVGATGGRPFPSNPETDFCGYCVQLLWRLHHRMALISPKLGEMIAFRKVMQSIPADSAVDEASIEALIRARGLKLKYIPSAVIHNRGPIKLRDFVKQRRRIQNGHLWLKSRQHYQVVSQDSRILFKVIISELHDNPFSVLKLGAFLAVELYSRLLGTWDYKVKGKNPFAWEIAKSAKRPLPGAKS